MQLLMETALVDLHSSVPARPANQQIRLWQDQKQQRLRTSTLLHSLGKRITAAQAKRLDTLDLSYKVLCEIRGCANDAEFQRLLKERGVHSKPLREKLTVIVPKIGNG